MNHHNFCHNKIYDKHILKESRYATDENLNFACLYDVLIKSFIEMSY